MSNINLRRFEVDVLAPSKHYVARAILVKGGYLAEFSAPGLVPRYVALTHDQENPTVFPSEQAAEEAARRALFGILNKPRRTQSRDKDVRYKKLSGPEFAVLLAESGLTLSLFCYLYGTKIDRAQSWLDGLDSAPHPARVLLEIFKANPSMVDVAENVTKAVTTARR